MNTATSCSWVITLSLMTILSIVVGTTPAHSQSAVAPGSVKSHPRESQETITPAKPRDSHLDGAMRSRRPADIPDQTPAPSVRARALEDRLRRGQMERAIVQGEISDRLEQLHSGSAESTTGETVSGQAVHGIAPD
jgi:hypothetical protein